MKIQLGFHEVSWLRRSLCSLRRRILPPLNDPPYTRIGELAIDRGRSSGRRATARSCVLIECMRLRRSGRPCTGLPPVLGLLLLSALWAADSLRGDLFPHFPVE